MFIFKNNPNAFDLIILDMVMPKMNGEQCFKKIKKINPDAKVILSSGFTHENEIENLIDGGHIELTHSFKQQKRYFKLITIQSFALPHLL